MVLVQPEGNDRYVKKNAHISKYSIKSKWLTYLFLALTVFVIGINLLSRVGAVFLPFVEQTPDNTVRFNPIFFNNPNKYKKSF